MVDYASNSKKSKEGKEIPEGNSKNIEKVVHTEVVIQKRGIGRKIKDLFIEADFKTVARYVAMDVLLPAAKNMIVDATTRGIDRMVYGESAIRRRNFGMGPRITYNNPVNRGFRDSPLRDSPLRDASYRYAPPTSSEPRTSRYNRNEFILSTREEGELVLERMTDIIDNYNVVSVADLNDLVGLPTTHVDNKWGWSNLNNVQVRQIREGYVIDFPSAEPIS